MIHCLVASVAVGSAYFRTVPETTSWCLTGPEKFWAINRTTQNTISTSVNKSQSSKAAHFLSRLTYVYFWPVLCDVLLTRFGHNRKHVSHTSRRCKKRNEALRAKIPTNKLYIHYRSFSALFETTIWTADCWVLTGISFGIIQQRQNYLKSSEF